MSKNKKPYFPHDWEGVMSTDFEAEVDWDDFYEFRVLNWQLPSSVACLLRVENRSSGKINEYVYQRPHAAKKKIEQIINNEKNTLITLCTHSSVSCLAASRSLVQGIPSEGEPFDGDFDDLDDLEQL